MCAAVVLACRESPLERGDFRAAKVGVCLLCAVSNPFLTELLPRVAGRTPSGFDVARSANYLDVTPPVGVTYKDDDMTSNKKTTALAVVSSNFGGAEGS
jgi:hypothetical protein